MIFNWKKKILDPIHIILDRDSVCAGDDAFSHCIEFDIDSSDTISDLLKKVGEISYLATIQGGKATWVISNKKTEIAVIAQQSSSPRFLLDEKTSIRDFNLEGCSIRFHFKYYVQKDPEIVYNERLFIRNQTLLHN